MTGTTGRQAQSMHADEVAIDDQLVRALIAEQFPEHADLPLYRAPSTGTDNAIYRLGRHLGLRLPRIHWAVPQIAKEHQWLPRLAPLLPTAVPEPVAIGEPSAEYPYQWLVYRWVDGHDALARPVADWCRLAEEVAQFVIALQRIDPSGAPAAGSRGGPLGSRDEITRRAIARLDGLIDTERATAVWAEAVAADAWTGPPVWVHADLLPGNVLVHNDRLGGIIDWSAAGTGDRACEAMLPWAMPPQARARYRALLDLDDAAWARARGWVIEQSVRFIPYYAATIPAGVAAARARLDAVLTDP